MSCQRCGALCARACKAPPDTSDGAFFLAGGVKHWVSVGLTGSLATANSVTPTIKSPFQAQQCLNPIYKPKVRLAQVAIAGAAILSIATRLARSTFTPTLLIIYTNLVQHEIRVNSTT